jgi:cell volume regulation protein A
VAGIVIGDEPAPYKREIQRFHSSLASLAEIVAFVMLGLTMRLSELASASAWAAGLALAALLAFVIRPVLGGLVSLPVRLTVPERVFFLWTGLRGAVPILLGMAIVASGTPGAARAYQVIFVIVGFSVTIQGGLVPTLAHRLRIPLRSIEPEPWSLGVRFSEEPEGLHRYHVTAGSAAEGSLASDLPCGENAWVSLVIRDGALLTVSDDTTLQEDDDVLLLADPDESDGLERFFTAPRTANLTAPHRELSSPAAPVDRWPGTRPDGCDNQPVIGGSAPHPSARCRTSGGLAPGGQPFDVSRTGSHCPLAPGRCPAPRPHGHPP